MDKGIYTALGSIKADRVKQGNSIHDVANVSTIGFKKAFEASGLEEEEFASEFGVSPERLKSILNPK